MIYTEPFKKHLKELISFWKPKLMLDHYHIELKFSEKKKEKEEEKEETDADISIDLIYLRGVITIYPLMAEYWKNRDYVYIQSIMVHELCHILSAEYSSTVKTYTANMNHEMLDDLNEQMVQTFANIMIKNKQKEN